MSKRQSDSESLPEDWVKRFSKTKNRDYYYNTKTNESVWEKPTLETQQTQKKTKTVQTQKIRCSHILVKHEGSRNPSSWKQAVIARTKTEASDILAKLREQIDSGETKFEEVASKESDCSSAHKGGDLGYFARGTMQKPFEEAAFSLKVGELSQIVSSDSGLHIILRTA